jgi:hypothetical protein
VVSYLVQRNLIFNDKRSVRTVKAEGLAPAGKGRAAK